MMQCDEYSATDVYTRELACEKPIEKIYYTVKYSPICIHSAEYVQSIPLQACHSQDIVYVYVCCVYYVYVT